MKEGQMDTTRMDRKVADDMLDLIGWNQFPWHKPKLCEKLLAMIENTIQMKGQDWVEENVEEVRDTIKATINVNDDEWHTA
jgi:hypothetical protein